MTNANVLDKIKDTARRILPENAQAILFGSRARGTAHAESDWDILILLDKDRVTYEDYSQVAHPFNILGWDIDAMISPIIYTKKAWEEASFTPFYKNVMSEGVLL